MKKFLVFLILLAFPNYAFAGLREDISDWFAENGAMIHENSASASYNAQAGGYASVGGFQLKNKTSRLNLVDIQAPSMSAGCGGISVYGGGIAGVSADEFKAFLQNVATSVPSLVYMLAMSTATPLLGDAIKKIKDWANEIKSFSKDSCQAAQALVAGGMRVAGLDHSDCVLRVLNSGQVDSYDKAMEICSNGQDNGAAKELENVFSFTKGNIAWFYLMRNDYFKTDETLVYAELLMNLTGTYIKGAEGKNDKQQYIQLALKDGHGDASYKALIEGFLDGIIDDSSFKRCKRDGDIYSPDKGCLTLEENTGQGNPVIGIRNDIKETISNIIEYQYKDVDFDDWGTREKNLLVKSKLPILRFLISYSAYYPKTYALNNSDQAMSEYVDLIASQILLTDLLRTVTELNSFIPTHGDEYVDDFRKQVEHVKMSLAEQLNNKMHELTAYENMMAKIEKYEKALTSRLSVQMMQNIEWGN